MSFLGESYSNRHSRLRDKVKHEKPNMRSIKDGQNESDMIDAKETMLHIWDNAENNMLGKSGIALDLCQTNTTICQNITWTS